MNGDESQSGRCVIGTQTGKHGKKENNSREGLKEEPEFYREPDIIPVKTYSGYEDRRKKKGRRNTECQARQDKCRQYSYARAARRWDGMGAAHIGGVEQALSKRHAGDEPGARRPQTRTREEKQDDLVFGNQRNQLNE